MTLRPMWRGRRGGSGTSARSLIGDYAKGTLTPYVVKRIITIARQAGKPVVVDPKHRDLSRYSGATVVTPNRSEVAVATGIDPLDDELAVQFGLIACEQDQATAVLVTRGADGMTLVQRDVANHFHSKARQVFDVSGAGDTVVAAVSLTLARGGHLETATRLANVAAGIAVSKSGTATVSRAELIEEILVTERDRLSWSAALQRVRLLIRDDDEKLPPTNEMAS